MRARERHPSSSVLHVPWAGRSLCLCYGSSWQTDYGARQRRAAVCCGSRQHLHPEPLEAAASVGGEATDGFAVAAALAPRPLSSPLPPKASAVVPPCRESWVQIQSCACEDRFGPIAPSQLLKYRMGECV